MNTNHPHNIVLLIIGMVTVVAFGGAYYGTGTFQPIVPESVLVSPEEEVPSAEQTEGDHSPVITPQKTVPTSQSSDAGLIKVLAPNGGEGYRKGDVVVITSVGGRRSDTGRIENGYFLIDEKGSVREIGYSGNSFSWRIDTTRDGVPIAPGRYKILVTSSYGPCRDALCAQTIQDESDAVFTISP
jgi:hypothetical protein